MDYQRKEEIKEHLWLAQNLSAIGGSSAQQAKMYIEDVQALQTEITQQETKYALLREELTGADKRVGIEHEQAEISRRDWARAIESETKARRERDEAVRQLELVRHDCLAYAEDAASWRRLAERLQAEFIESSKFIVRNNKMDTDELSGRLLLAEQFVKELTPLVPKCQKLEGALEAEKQKNARYEREAQEYLGEIQDLREERNLLEHKCREFAKALAIEKCKNVANSKEIGDHCDQIVALGVDLIKQKAHARKLREALLLYAYKDNWQQVDIALGRNMAVFSAGRAALWTGTNESGWAIARRVLDLSEATP